MIKIEKCQRALCLKTLKHNKPWPYGRQCLTTLLVWLSHAERPWHSLCSCTLNGSLIRTSKALWRNTASLLNLTRHCRCTPKGRWCLNVYLQCANAHQTWRCRRQKACKFEPRAASNLVCWFDKRDYQVFWMLSHAVALSGHWRAISDVVNVKDGSRPAAVSTPCMETGPG